MRNTLIKYIKVVIAVAMIAFTCGLGCKKVYNPKIVSSGANYLVVEGVINTGADSSSIRLSRTVPVSSRTGATPETGAVISIISDAGVTYPVLEKGNGYYTSVPINGGGQAKYALKITTKNGENYQSDFVAAVNAPPIDSVYHRVQGAGVNIYLDTHDPTNTAKYYRWDYTDTYLFHTEYSSTGYVVKTPADTILLRPAADQVYQCWHNDTSTAILLNSTAKLSQAVISRTPITSIPSTSIKISNRYSIQVNQYALTADAFNYYQLLQQNTESIGSIFDPQPSELPSNIHCLSKPSEVVVGYITAGIPAKSRIFIDTHNLPAWLSDNPYADCALDTDYFAASGQESSVGDYLYTGVQTPVDPISVLYAGQPVKLIGWSASSAYCVDCTLNGTNIRPPFWTDFTE